MSEIQKIDNSLTLELLTATSQGKENFVAILELMAKQFNDLEQSIFEIRDNFYLDDAEGVQLDTIGQIVDVNRNGANDTDYRQTIKDEFQILFSSGEPESIIKTLKALYGATFVDYFPGHLNGEVASFIQVSDAVITKTQLEAISPAGVGAYIGNYLIESAPSDDFIVLNNGEKIIITS